MPFKTPCRPIICETLDVKHLDERRIMDMKVMFGVATEPEQRTTTHHSNKENSHRRVSKYKLPTLSEKPSKNVLTERNKFEIFRIKEELE